jgi:PIN domain nuclease of toxin-antitoxin system
VRVLLDTHAFLWATSDDERLSYLARDLIRDPEQELLFSPASAYEIAVKTAAGRLQLPEDAATYVTTRIAMFALQTLPITVEHAVEAASLPPIHADPWDRLLVAQARAEAVPILTADRLVRQYDVETIW